jgi:hypothetical protein
MEESGHWRMVTAFAGVGCSGATERNRSVGFCRAVVYPRSCMMFGTLSANTIPQDAKLSFK